MQSSELSYNQKTAVRPDLHPILALTVNRYIINITHIINTKYYLSLSISIYATVTDVYVQARKDIQGK